MTPDSEMIEKVARAIGAELPSLENGEAIQRRLARAAIAAYNPNDRLREALERDELVREAMFVLSDRLRASGILSASDAVHEAYEAYEAVVAALSHKD